MSTSPCRNFSAASRRRGLFLQSARHWQATNGIFISPFLAERAKLGQERPCRTILVMEMQQLVGDRERLYEEIVGRIGHAFAHSRHVDYGVDQDIGDVDAAR